MAEVGEVLPGQLRDPRRKATFLSKVFFKHENFYVRLHASQLVQRPVDVSCAAQFRFASDSWAKRFVHEHEVHKVFSTRVSRSFTDQCGVQTPVLTELCLEAGKTLPNGFGVDLTSLWMCMLF